jgi:hypothetical protein
MGKPSATMATKSSTAARVGEAAEVHGAASASSNPLDEVRLMLERQALQQQETLNKFHEAFSATVSLLRLGVTVGIICPSKIPNTEALYFGMVGNPMRRSPSSALWELQADTTTCSSELCSGASSLGSIPYTLDGVKLIRLAGLST